MVNKKTTNKKTANKGSIKKVKVNFRGKKFSATKTPKGYKGKGLGYKASARKKGNTLSIRAKKAKKKSIFDKLL